LAGLSALVGWVESSALPFRGTRQVFDTRNASTFKKDRNPTQHTRFFVISLAASARGQWSV
jgi:hypothetical protein